MYEQGKLGAAINVLNKAVEMDGDNAKAHAVLGSAYFDSNETQKALRHLQRAVALNPKNGQALVILGNVHQALGNSDQAKSMYQKYLKLAPNGKFADDVKMILQALP